VLSPQNTLRITSFDVIIPQNNPQFLHLKQLFLFFAIDFVFNTNNLLFLQFFNLKFYNKKNGAFYYNPPHKITQKNNKLSKTYFIFNVR